MDFEVSNFKDKVCDHVLLFTLSQKLTYSVVYIVILRIPSFIKVNLYRFHFIKQYQLLKFQFNFESTVFSI